MTQPVSILIVDDEPVARQRIRDLLAADADVRDIWECASIAQCEQLDSNIVPDLVFLDVQMPERDGFELLQYFDARHIEPLIIFVTAHAEYAVSAYAAGAVDYLLKPFDDERFAKAMTRSKATLSALRYLDTANIGDTPTETQDLRPELDRLLVNEDGRIWFIPTGDIELIQAAGKHVKIFVREQCYITRQSLRMVEMRLGSKIFVRVHRSTIINVNHIVELHPLLHGDCELVLRRGTRVTLSRRFRHRLQPFFVGSWTG
jgi:two-component system LytT family response regulator